ncbi:MAG TPA: fumarylacetoacetate hydrolase family protein [Xanthomonadales bacterium]|nr:fumarylacetoacetate hydrolase family protein [Xanthomonadales bacterium]
MEYVFAPEPPVSLAVHGSKQRFPVRRIYCVGQNYGAHAVEMGSDPNREPPFFFTKPAQAVVTGGQAAHYPSRTRNLHHEIELVVALASGGSNITAGQAWDHVFGLAVGLDLTRRDLQGEAKKAGRPWDTGKAFDESAPLSELHPLSETGHVSRGRIWLQVNGESRQEGDVSQMIWSIPEVIAELSTLFTLQPGDLIFTGTPAGVSAIQPGDVLEGGVEGVARLHVEIL